MRLFLLEREERKMKGFDSSFSIKIDFYGKGCTPVHMKGAVLRRLWFDLLMEDEGLFYTKKDDPSPMRTVWSALLALAENSELAPFVERATIGSPLGESDATGFGYEHACRGLEDWVVNPIKRGFDSGDVFCLHLEEKPKTASKWSDRFWRAKDAGRILCIESTAIDCFLEKILVKRFEYSEENRLARESFFEGDFDIKLKDLYFDCWGSQAYSTTALKKIRSDVSSVMAELEYVIDHDRVDGCRVWLRGGLQGFRGLDDELRPIICSPWELSPSSRCTVEQALSFYRQFDFIVTNYLLKMDPEKQILYVDGP